MNEDVLNATPAEDVELTDAELEAVTGGKVGTFIDQRADGSATRYSWRGLRFRPRPWMF